MSYIGGTSFFRGLGNYCSDCLGKGDICCKVFVAEPPKLAAEHGRSPRKVPNLQKRREVDLNNSFIVTQVNHVRSLRPIILHFAFADLIAREVPSVITWHMCRPNIVQ